MVGNLQATVFLAACPRHKCCHINDSYLLRAAGRVVEYDTPYNLLGKASGVFTQLVESTGPQAASKLRGMRI
jgi:hypothetical protein